ncbi:unnamed protein product [Cuscuta campestris]|uniref:non-specific serine/threonine protein kinase n=1 Tax=Cuscuta campestris TaxID=132261 RepID=A0A484N2K0_9ASTE|nr:unnamed protein product [Cuscuta campestris]
MGFRKLPFLLFLAIFALLFLHSVSQAGGDDDASAMLALKKSLNPPPEMGWSGPDPCKWSHVVCSGDKRVTRIQIGHQNLQGTLPPELSRLTQLDRLEVQWNNISGPLPSLNGLSSLRVLMLSNNRFTSIPIDFFEGLSSLQSVEIDNNPLNPWQIPDSLRNASSLQNFSANSVTLWGRIPGFFDRDGFPGLVNLHLARNNLEGELPSGFSGMSIESLHLNGQKLGGGIDVLQNMTMLKEVWLHSNSFSGPLPDFSGLKALQVLNLRDNSFTGPVPLSLVNLDSLKVVNVTNNLLQGPTPKFKDSVSVDLVKDTNSFCLPQPGDCDSRVNTLLLIAKSLGYPKKFAENWKGNDPCADWSGITCKNGNITIVNFQNMGLTGTISPAFASLKTLQRLILAKNNLSGIIPEELTSIATLTDLDVSNNQLYGKVPAFRSNVIVNTNGNPNIGTGKSDANSPASNSPGSSNPGSHEGGTSLKSPKKFKIWILILVSVVGSVLLLSLMGMVAFCVSKNKKVRFSRVQSPPTAMVIHPRHSGSDNNNSVKITVVGSTEMHTVSNNQTTEFEMGEARNLVISIQVLRNVTNNFSEDHIIGRGGFGTVYKGELHDGTKIAVKRMECGIFSGKGLEEFKSEISVLTKVRHRHLVALLGYCLDENEKLLVYEFMPQGTLSRHLFDWAGEEEGLEPLDWTKRLTIALDVARGVEYLHKLAHQSFIHRDLKPSNILLGDDMRAKVSDFGLVRLAPEGKGSIHTKIAGTFGYLAPEYAVTGRVTTKVDVYSFGVILMELITGRKALDETQPEESMHLVTWFRRMHLNRESFRKAIDPTIDFNEETLASISTVAELASHCCAREPHQRPDMGHAVNVLSSLVEFWKPSEESSEDVYGIDLDMSLPQVLKKWQALEGSTSHAGYSSTSSYAPGLDNAQTCYPSAHLDIAQNSATTVSLK